MITVLHAEKRGLNNPTLEMYWAQSLAGYFISMTQTLLNRE